MAGRFTKVSEEEIKTAFLYPSDLVNTKTTSRLGIYPPLFTSPSGNSCIILSVSQTQEVSLMPSKILQMSQRAEANSDSRA